MQSLLLLEPNEKSGGSKSQVNSRRTTFSLYKLIKTHRGLLYAVFIEDLMTVGVIVVIRGGNYRVTHDTILSQYVNITILSQCNIMFI